MVLPYLTAAIKRNLLKKNIGIVRFVKKGMLIKTSNIDFEKKFTDTKDGKTYAIDFEGVPIYHELTFFGPVPVVYYDEEKCAPVGIGQGSGLRARTLKALYEDEVAYLRAMFWAQASWLLGKGAQVGGLLLLVGALGGLYFAFTGAGTSQTCVELMREHISTTATIANQTAQAVIANSPNFPKV